MSRSWAAGSTYAWRVLRRAILRANAHERAGRCQLDVGQHCQRHNRPCPGVCTGMATEVHHARGKAFGDDPRYLVATCRACNAHVGDPTHADVDPRPRTHW